MVNKILVKSDNGKLKLSDLKHLKSRKHIQRSLNTAYAFGKLTIARALEKKIKNPNRRNGFEWACKNGKLNSVRFLVNKMKYSSIKDGFLGACDRKRVKVIKFLLPKLKNATIRTVFKRACKFKDKSLIRVLMKSKAKLNYARCMGKRV